ncbi:MAG: hypothetical protein H7Y38_01060 [Armatimonadetes bacterium]|nr:hypothetical protein [Armatimonadota bacterium]
MESTIWVKNIRTGVLWEVTPKHAAELLREVDGDGGVYERSEKPEADKPKAKPKAASGGEQTESANEGETAK